MSLPAPAAAAIDALGPLVDEAVASGRPLALLMLGLQGQRRFRIEQGHEAAAALARRVGELAGEVLRPGDLIVPVGAADFALALPGIGEGNHALLAAARPARASTRRIPSPMATSVSVSAGVVAGASSETSARSASTDCPSASRTSSGSSSSYAASLRT